MHTEPCPRHATTRSPKQPTSSGSPSPRCVDGRPTASSQQSERRAVKGSSISPPSALKASSKNTTDPPAVLLSTPGSRRRSNATTSNAKRHTCCNITLSNQQDKEMFLKSQMLDPDSTSRGPDFYEFWDSSRAAVYQKLSWLQETGWHGLDLNSSSGCATSTAPKSWFSTTRMPRQKKSSGKTSCPLFKFTAADGTVDVGMPTKVTKALKLRLRPTIHQKKILNEWAGCCRFTYNKAIALLLNKQGTHKHPIALQNRLVIKQKRGKDTINSFLAGREWLERCPSAVRKKAVREAKANLQACFTNLRNKNITHFTAPYKTKKKELQTGWSISMEKANVVVKNEKSLYIYGRLLGEMRYFRNKQLRKLIPGVHPEQDCKLQRDRYGDYYLIVTQTSTPTKKNKDIVNVTSVDPGVRKFATTYSNDEVMFYGNRWATKITQMTLHVDNLCSRKSKAVGKRKWVLQQRINRIRKQIHNCKKEMRYQVANQIVRSSDLVLMPKLSTKDLVIKCKRRLTTKTAKQLLAACHGMFFDHLRLKCHERGKRFMVVSEHYTSKTCPHCGVLNNCNEVFRCKSCNFVHDRDAVGALNILLRAVRQTNSSSEDTGS